jgi:hypothetical protein
MLVTSYSTVVNNLTKASIPVRELEGEGLVAVTLAAGRIVAMGFSREGPDLLWSNPQLADTTVLETAPENLVGGFGGDRLWFAPELDYYWNGAPDWRGFTNYKAPPATDPGAYEFIDAGADAVGLLGKGTLTAHGGGERRVDFNVRRSVRMAEPPLSRADSLMKGVDFVGIETSHSLKMDAASRAGSIDLWHLLQMPAGSVLVVPINSRASASERKPLSYGLPGGWIEKSDHIMWRYGGEAHAKFGLPAAALTGRTAVLRQLDQARWCLIVRDFSADSRAFYGDHPYQVPRSDQAFQAWDGYGFGEMEYHSPMLNARKRPGKAPSSAPVVVPGCALIKRDRCTRAHYRTGGRYRPSASPEP